MKKNKLYTFILFFFLLLAGCNKNMQDHFLLEGKISNLQSDEIYFVTEDRNMNIFTIDTVPLQKEGYFTYQGKADSLSSIIIYMNNGSVWTTIWVKNKEKIIISGDAVYPELIQAKGNSVNDLLSEFKEQNKTLLKERRDLIDTKENLVMIDSIISEANDNQYTSKILNLNYTLKDKVRDFITRYPQSLASVILLQDYLLDPDNPEESLEYFGLVTGDATETPLYKAMQKELNDLFLRITQSQVGAVAPEFSVIDTNNDTINLEYFNDKYLLLSFSASWCKYCAQENKELVKTRNRIKNDKLGMLTIALDEDEKAWENVVKNENMNWKHFIDTTGWRSEIAYNYNINTIPANILIDKNNIIVGRNLPSDSIIVILNENK